MRAEQGNAAFAPVESARPAAKKASPRVNARLIRLFRFGLVGVSGLVVNQGAIWVFTERLHVYYLLSAVLATQCSTAWNFALSEVWVFRAERSGRAWRAFWFALLNNAWLIARAPIMYGLTELVGLNYLVSNLISLGVATLARFAIADSRIWRPAAVAVATDPAIEAEAIEQIDEPTTGDEPKAVYAKGPETIIDGSDAVVEIDGNEPAVDLTPLERAMEVEDEMLPPWDWRRARLFYYDVHGMVGIRSEAPLPELSRFMVTELNAKPDIAIRVRDAGFGGLRRRAAVMKDGDAITYVEHLGAAGFAMRIEPGKQPGDTTNVSVSRLLKASPHVLYTNVIEPLLRWEIVKRGSILAHAACLEIDGTGVLITAQTDTGKTTTCIRSIRENGSRFASDDMIIVSPDGVARSFPKPMTISAHTLKAARSSPLPLRSRIWLELQGRLHSKGGRRVGLAMTTWNIPVCTLNALVQVVVPPPKFHVRQLVPSTEIVDRMKLSHLIVIERGDELTENLDAEAATRFLTDNTEDAYGFPPYPLIADLIANGEHAVEADIRRRIVGRVSAVRLRTPDRTWFDQLSAVVAAPAHPGVVVPELVGEAPDAIKSGSNGRQAGHDTIGATWRLK
jgi:dolichol-phosphate mannosyltransferase